MKKEKLTIPAGTAVTVSTYFNIVGIDATSSFGIAFYDAERNIISQANSITNGTSKTLTFDKDVAYVAIVWIARGATNGDYVEFNNIKLQLGNTATEYEPYGYKIPVTVSGKNLFDGNMQQGAYLVAEGNYVGVTNYICNKNPIYVDDTKNYYISRKDASEGYLQYILCYGENDTYLGYVSVSNKGSTFKPLENTKYINFDIVKASDKSNITAQEAGLIQIEEGTAATEYESYQGSTTTNIYLDEPLRKVGDYADYIDFASGKIVRNVKKRIITSNDKLLTMGRGISFYESIDIIKPSSTTKLPTTLCSHYNKAEWAYTISSKGTKEGACINSSSNLIGFYDAVYANSLEKFKTFLDSNECSIYYALAMPLEKEIDLPSIKATKGTCVIKVDTSVKPSSIQVNYK